MDSHSQPCLAFPHSPKFKETWLLPFYYSTKLLVTYHTCAYRLELSDIFCMVMCQSESRFTEEKERNAYLALAGNPHPTNEQVRQAWRCPLQAGPCRRICSLGGGVWQLSVDFLVPADLLALWKNSLLSFPSPQILLPNSLDNSLILENDVYILGIWEPNSH